MKNFFLIINIILLTYVAFFGVEIMYSSLELLFTDNSLHFKKKLPTEHNDRKSAMFKHRNYSKIVSANIFNVKTERKEKVSKEKSDLEDIAKLKKTPLKLKLSGTILSDDAKDSYVVIQDQKAKNQSLYQAGQLVQGAEIIKILRQKVIIRFNGENQVLEMDGLPDLPDLSEIDVLPGSKPI